jgi:uncharacterized protein HemY
MMVCGRSLQAVYVLDELLARQPDDFDAWLLMGVARAIVGDEDGFVNGWPDAPPAAPGQPLAWVQLSRRCAANNKWAAARRYLEFAAQHNAGISEPLVLLADTAAEFKQADLQGQLLEEAARAYPSSPTPWLRLCDLALATKNTSSARDYLAQAERRGASPAEIASRREQTGGSAAAPHPFGTVVR